LAPREGVCRWPAADCVSVCLLWDLGADCRRAPASAIACHGGAPLPFALYRTMCVGAHKRIGRNGSGAISTRRNSNGCSRCARSQRMPLAFSGLAFRSRCEARRAAGDARDAVPVPRAPSAPRRETGRGTGRQTLLRARGSRLGGGEVVVTLVLCLLGCRVLPRTRDAAARVSEFYTPLSSAPPPPIPIFHLFAVALVF